MCDTAVCMRPSWKAMTVHTLLLEDSAISHEYMKQNMKWKTSTKKTTTKKTTIIILIITEYYNYKIITSIITFMELFCYCYLISLLLAIIYFYFTVGTQKVHYSILPVSAIICNFLMGCDFAKG